MGDELRAGPASELLPGRIVGVGTGRMVRGPQGIVAKVPGLGAANKLLARVLPLRRGKVEARDGTLYVC